MKKQGQKRVSRRLSSKLVFRAPQPRSPGKGGARKNHRPPALGAVVESVGEEDAAATAAAAAAAAATAAARQLAAALEEPVVASEGGGGMDVEGEEAWQSAVDAESGRTYHYKYDDAAEA